MTRKAAAPVIDARAALAALALIRKAEINPAAVTPGGLGTARATLSGLVGAFREAAQPVLDEAQGRARERLLQPAALSLAAREAEARLDAWGIPQAARAGVSLYITPGREAFPARYAAKSRTVAYTAASLVREGKGRWRLQAVARRDAWTSDGVPGSRLLLPDAVADMVRDRLLEEATAI